MSIPAHKNIIVIEDSSLELVPRKFWNSPSCKLVEERFGQPPDRQLLDDNFHHDIVQELRSPQKRGRPDIVHLALLDITSTPLYLDSLVSIAIRTVENETIFLKQGVRLPRTLHRFSGLIAKILAGEMREEDSKLFDHVKSQSFKELISIISPSIVISFSTEGTPRDLRGFVSNILRNNQTQIAWVIGGFARGHFGDQVKEYSDQIISISPHSLPSHVVSSRLSYELEYNTTGKQSHS